MKISKEYLKLVITEEIKNILENPEDDFITNNISIDTFTKLTGISFSPEEYPHERVQINKVGNVYTVSTRNSKDKGFGLPLTNDKAKEKFKQAIIDASNLAKKQVERERQYLARYDNDMD